MFPFGAFASDDCVLTLKQVCLSAYLAHLYRLQRHNDDFINRLVFMNYSRIKKFYLDLHVRLITVCTLYQVMLIWLYTSLTNVLY